MIDHVSVAVRDLTRSGAFYDTILQPLGFQRLAEHEHRFGYGAKYPEFWINHRPDMAAAPEDSGHHVCLRAATRDAVKSFYAAAVIHGGRGDGEPKDRQATVTAYFGAFIRDPDGNKIEALALPIKNQPADKPILPNP